jgi:hypothetical protein
MLRCAIESGGICKTIAKIKLILDDSGTKETPYKILLIKIKVEFP